MHPAKVLVVDDEPANRFLVREVLEQQGYGVAEAADGEQALAAVAAQPPDLILLDVRMPRRDGYSVCRALKADPRTRLVPVVMLTSLDDLEDKIRAVEAGADDFLTKPFNAAELTTRARSLIALKRYTDELEHAEKVLEGLAITLEVRDGYTGDHVKRVGRSATLLGEALRQEPETIRALRLAGFLHDLGKIAIPDGILRKPGPLTPEEMEAIRAHPIIGVEICRPMRTMETVLPLIRHHHEKLDGSGYPDGLRGDQIPLPVRILTVADVFDALTVERPYKRAFTRDESLAILREETRKGWWDPEIVETLARLLKDDLR